MVVPPRVGVPGRPLQQRETSASRAAPASACYHRAVTRRRRGATGDVDRAIDAAIEDLGGAVIVLGPGLEVVRATPSAVTLVGTDLPVGVPAPRLLCGGAVNRPIAEAMARGVPVTGTIHRPDRARGVDRGLRIRASPLDREGPGGKVTRVGWVLLLDALSETGPDAPECFSGLWTRSVEMKRVFHIVERAAQGEVTVLIRGETGTGKELVARALHARSPRAKGPFAAINCAAVPASLLESELFGHVRGAFTGAHRDHPGFFRSAHKGTVFLDELGEMPLALQAKLLRVLETRTVIPVGGREPIAVDVRVVAATHQSLRQAVAEGRFRADLMYRLRVVPIFLPPLRQRPADVSLLAQKLVEERNAAGGRQVSRIAPAALAALERYPWPGNVRELRNALEYAYVIGEGPVLDLRDLPPEIATPEAEVEVPLPSLSTPPAAPAEPPEVARIQRALERAAGHRGRAAQILGMSRVTLWRRMRELRIAS
jgi:DNA-binding NtrC family response regulator